MIPASGSLRRAFGVITLVLGLLAPGHRLGASTAEAKPEICKDFSEIVAASAHEFEGFRGELISQHVDPLSDTRVVWRCIRVLTGANACEVDWTDQTLSYQAFWNRQSAEQSEQVFGALTELLTSCGFELREISKTNRSLWLIRPGEPDLDITLAHNNHRTRLTFARLGVPAPAPAPSP